MTFTSTVEKPSWRCGCTFEAAKAVELAAVAVRGCRSSSGCGRRVGLLVVDEQQRVGVEVALVDPVALQLLVDHLAELLDADLVDQELDAGAGAVGAQVLLAVEDAQHRLGDLQVLAVVDGGELPERCRRRAA